MKEFEFTLKFSLPDTSVDFDDCVEQLGAEECDDAIIGIGQTGRIALRFNREANSAFDAVTSALSDVKRAVPGAKLIEAAPDLVGLTDLAEIIGCSRQYMRKLMVVSGPDFPNPVHEGKLALWRLAAILLWLKEKRDYQIEDKLLEVAQINMQLNVAKEMGCMKFEMHEDIRRLVS